MKHTFNAIITADVEMSAADLRVIIAAAETHYDHTVKAASERGGFLYGAKNRMDFGGGPRASIHLTERQLGLALKALEMSRHADAPRITCELLDIVRALQSKWTEVSDGLYAGNVRIQ